MARAKSSTSAGLAQQTLVLDNGSYTIKAGLVDGSGPQDSSGSALPASRIIPNCLFRSRNRKVYVASEVEACVDYGEMAYRRPMDRGCVVHWDLQREIWDREFFGKGGAGDRSSSRWALDPADTNLILTESPTSLPALSSAADQIAFEDYGFASYLRTTPGVLIAHNDIESLFRREPSTRVVDGAEEQGTPMDVDPPSTPSIPSFPRTEAFLLVDAGFSSTEITAYLHGRPIRRAGRRLDVGGNLLTNYLKEMVSIRHYDMMDEVHTINAIKEEVCYVTDDLNRDMDLAWKPDKRAGGGNTKSGKDRDGDAAATANVVLDYVLPDWNEGRPGFSQPHVPARQRAAATAAAPATDRRETMTLANERFSVPELLFRPAGVQLGQAGLPGAIVQVLEALPAAAAALLRPAMLANVVLVGGCARLPGYATRLATELRMRVPDRYPVRVGLPGNGGDGDAAAAVAAAAATDSGPDGDGQRSERELGAGTGKARCGSMAPVTWACEGGMRLARDHREELARMVVTKQEYEEHGALWTARRFAGKS